jgi:hypothetical protein
LNLDRLSTLNLDRLSTLNLDSSFNVEAGLPFNEREVEQVKQSLGEEGGLAPALFLFASWE